MKKTSPGIGEPKKTETALDRHGAQVHRLDPVPRLRLPAFLSWYGRWQKSRGCVECGGGCALCCCRSMACPTIRVDAACAVTASDTAPTATCLRATQGSRKGDRCSVRVPTPGYSPLHPWQGYATASAVDRERSGFIVGGRVRVDPGARLKAVPWHQRARGGASEPASWAKICAWSKAHAAAGSGMCAAGVRTARRVGQGLAEQRPPGVQEVG